MSMFRRTAVAFLATAGLLLGGVSTAIADDISPSTESALEPAAPAAEEEPATEAAPVALAVDEEPAATVGDTVSESVAPVAEEDSTSTPTNTEEVAAPAPPAPDTATPAAEEECVGTPDVVTDPLHTETGAFTGVTLEWVGGACNGPATFTFEVDGVTPIDPIEFDWSDVPMHVDLNAYVPPRDGEVHYQAVGAYGLDGAGYGESVETRPWYADGYFAGSLDEAGVVTLTVTGNLYVVDTEGDTYYSTDSFVLDKERTFTALPTIEGEAVAPWVLSPWTATPPDSDGDGVPDALDDCPDVAGSADNDGCPASTDIDGDNDGVNDSADQCPGTPAGEVANADGCSDSQLDDDSDGVNNDADQCPGTPAGEVANADGCSDSQLDDDSDERLCRNDNAKGKGACSDTHPGLIKGKAHGLSPEDWFEKWVRWVLAA